MRKTDIIGILLCILLALSGIGQVIGVILMAIN